MSSTKWRNAMIALLLIAVFIFVVDVIMIYFLTAPNVPDVGIQDVKKDLTAIFNVVNLFALVGAVILLPIWIYKYAKERKQRKGETNEQEPKPEKKDSKNEEKDDEYVKFLGEPED